MARCDCVAFPLSQVPDARTANSKQPIRNMLSTLNRGPARCLAWVGTVEEEACAHQFDKSTPLHIDPNWQDMHERRMTTSDRPTQDQSNKKASRS